MAWTFLNFLARCGGLRRGILFSSWGFEYLSNYLLDLINFHIPFQGYLSVNRFGTFLGLAHAAMTAEGDNSVLMQKVAKEHLGKLMKSPPKMPKLSPNGDLQDKAYLLSLLKTRELKLFYELGQKMSAAGREGTFTTWMLQESDLIQMAARGYGDNLIAER